MPMLNGILGAFELITTLLYYRFQCRSETSSTRALMPMLLFWDIVFTCFMLAECTIIPLSTLYQPHMAGKIIGQIIALLLVLVSIVCYKVGYNYYYHNLSPEKRARVDQNNQPSVRVVNPPR